jgi:hypothetical protein
MPVTVPTVDDFTGVDATTLTTPPRAGLPWKVNPDGAGPYPSYQLAGNQARPDAAGGWIYFDSTYGPNCQAAFLVPVLPGGTGVVEIGIRLINLGTLSLSGYYGGVNPGLSTFYVGRMDNDVPTTLNSQAGAFTDGDEVAVECSGSTISVMRNGVAMASTVDATYSQAGGAYIYTDGTVVRLDNFRFGNTVEAGRFPNPGFPLAVAA